MEEATPLIKTQMSTITQEHQDVSRIVSVINVCKRKEPIRIIDKDLSKESLLASQMRASCVILH